MLWIDTPFIVILGDIGVALPSKQLLHIASLYVPSICVMTLLIMQFTDLGL
jgi:hypothetical protein